MGLVRNGVCSQCGGNQRGGKDRAYDTKRGTAAERGYDATWRKLRRMQLSRYPLCHDCKVAGVLMPGGEVHHIRAKRDGGTNSFDNLMTLCKSCHSKRTANGE
jgi:5-methylcytosine-specific restriction protein A